MPNPNELERQFQEQEKAAEERAKHPRHHLDKARPVTQEELAKQHAAILEARKAEWETTRFQEAKVEQHAAILAAGKSVVAAEQAGMAYCPECGIKSSAGAKVLAGGKGSSQTLRRERDEARATVDSLDAQLSQAFRECNDARARAGRLEREVELLSNPHGRYSYFVAGHIIVHPPLSAKLERYTAPFDTVIQTNYPLDDDKALDRFRKTVTTRCQQLLAEQAKNHLVADVTLRQVSLLHTEACKHA